MGGRGVWSKGPRQNSRRDTSRGTGLVLSAVDGRWKERRDVAALPVPWRLEASCRGSGGKKGARCHALGQYK